MKRMARYGWIDIAIRPEKQLLVLVCDTPEHAQKFFDFLKSERCHFSDVSNPDLFRLSLSIIWYGDFSVSITPQHSSFHLATHITNKNICQFTTGAMQENNCLGYLKDTIPMPGFRSQGKIAKSSLPHVSRKEPDSGDGSINKIKKAIERLFSS